MITSMSPLARFAYALALLMLTLGLAAAPADARKKKGKRGKRAKAGKKFKTPKAAPDTKPSANADTKPAKGAAAEKDAELEPTEMDIDRVMAHATALTKIGPRPANSEQARAAADYIRQELTSMGLEIEEQPVGSQTAPAIEVSGFASFPEYTFDSSDPNLIVRIHVKGHSKDDPLLFMAHYDTVADSPGAVDNAVSVGLLLELARYLKHGGPMRTIVLVWTAAEENRMIGSIPLAEKFAEGLGFVVSLDLIGSPGTLTLNGLSDLIGRGWLMWLAEVSKQAKIDISAPWTHRAISLLFPDLERSDHAAFSDRGVPAIHLYTRGDDRIYLPYHTEHDTMAQVDRKSVEDAADFIAAMSDTKFSFPKPGGNQGLWVPFPGSPKVSSTLAAQALEFMFLFFAIMSLVKLRKEDRERSLGKKKSEDSGERSLGVFAGLGAYVLVWIGTAVLIALVSMGSHALAWAHAPGRFTIGALLIAGALGYAIALQSGRLGKWVGDTRFLIPAVAVTGFIGFFILATGIYEIAWIFLLPSAVLGGIGRAKSFMRGCVYWLLATLPLLGPLAPGFLRESVFHGFYPTSLSLSTYVAFFVFPQTLALIFLVQRWRPSLPKGKGALIACGVVAALGLGIIASYSAPCSNDEFKASGLACEIGR